MYISTIQRADSVYVWERTDSKRVVKEFPAPYYFYYEDDEGEFTSVFGKPLSRADFDTKDEFQALASRLKGRNKPLYESDISCELKVLMEHYYNATPPKLHITLLDIEVDYDETIGFSSVSNPYAPINAIALYNMHQNRSVVLVVPPPNWDKSTFDGQLHDLAEVVFCKNEKELLLRFLDEIEDTDMLSGWNSQFFDIPYICERIVIALGKAALSRMCFEGARPPRKREVEVFGNIQFAYDLYGRVHLDYMDLFRKYEVAERPSYKLESIAEEVLPHLPKLQYEGSLARLYKENFNWFVRYNIRDTEILVGFERKLGYIQLANVMAHMSTAKFNDVLGTIRLADMAIVNYIHREMDQIVPDWREQEDGSIRGAFVLLPQIGMHKNIGSIDINSLYPSGIRSLNISPETLVGQFLGTIADFEAIARRDASVECSLEYDSAMGGRTGVEVHTAAEWFDILWDRKQAVSGYGTVFSQEKQGVVPAILESWYKQRKHYQKLSGEAYKQAEQCKQGSKEHQEQVDLHEYYDKLQYVYKIKLNSLYGALTNYRFRFFRLNLGESTTGTGRAILRHQCRKTSELLDGSYNVDFPLYETVADAIDSGEHENTALLGPQFKGTFQAPSVVYGDTDSTYFVTHCDTASEAIKVADYVANQVNKSYQQFMQDTFRCQPGFDDIIKCGREVVADNGIFVNKKRYILHLIDKDGHTVDQMKIMGLELKKTTLPRPVQAKLVKFMEQLLTGADWDDVAKEIVAYKTELSDPMKIIQLGLPKGVKGLEEYTRAWEADPKTRLPGHVASSILYNNLITKYGDKTSSFITSGTKIRVFYLKVPIGRFKAISLPTDTTEIPEWFTEHIVPNINVDSQIERLVDKPLEKIFTAIKKVVPSIQTLYLDDLFCYD